MSNSDSNETGTADVPSPTKVSLPAVDSRSVTRAATHLKLALDAEGFAGAMIYSQNCFASLATSFSWAKLDQCEAFDSLAQVAMSQSRESGSEATYFAKDGTETRFMTVALQHQGEVDSVQSHLSDLARAAFARIADLQSQVVASQDSHIEAAEAPDVSVGESDQLSNGSDQDPAEGLPTNKSY